MQVVQVVTGAMGPLIPKLAVLLKDEYQLQMGVKKDVQRLRNEMSSMQAALLKVAELPPEQLDEQVKLWAAEIRELSYNMEDAVDKFLVRVDHAEVTKNSTNLKQLMDNMISLFKKGMARHEIAVSIKDIKEQVQDVATRRDKYKVDGIVATTPVDPRLRALYTEAAELVGIHGKRDQELMELLSMRDDDVDDKKLKIVSIVGFGGLGKTTLAKAVYDKIKSRFKCSAFVPVGRNPNAEKVLRDILIDLSNSSYSDLVILDCRQLINRLRSFLDNKRYLIIIDDIWDTKLWEAIKPTFPNKDSVGSRLITTTRIVSVSKACCSPTPDMVYNMKPLSDSDSQKLFYKRTFSHESGCPAELEPISKDILKKCGGVPLAIITIGGVLVDIKSEEKWLALLHSIGRGLSEDASLEEMQRILSLSYYDLPSHLRTCLLYLSLYPEDTDIMRDQLIRKWIAEGFVQHEKRENGLFELGENYFNELINRSIIQPVYDNLGDVECCRVHYMVLDLICSLSREANFVTILDGAEVKSSPYNVRRLSLQHTKENLQTNSMNMSKVRSITVFSHAFRLMPPFSSFDVLRVLDLRHCDLKGSSSLGDVGNLLHLRYLGLEYTFIRELPVEIGNLRLLQVLDVGGKVLGGNDYLQYMPPTVCKLRMLTVLNVDVRCKCPPEMLENMTSIKVLGTITASLGIVKEQLCKLARLRSLRIQFDDESVGMEEAFVASICRLHNIQNLHIEGKFGSQDLLGQLWVPPPHLRSFGCQGVSSAIPAWIKRRDPMHLWNHLSHLNISVKEVQQEDVRIMGRLPALRFLGIDCSHQTQRQLVVGAGDFSSMIEFYMYSPMSATSPAHIVLERGALPRAETVVFSFSVQVAKDNGNAHFDFGLQGNLLSLRSIGVNVHRDGATIEETKEAEDAMRRAIDCHPNHLFKLLAVKVKPTGNITDYELMTGARGRLRK